MNDLQSSREIFVAKCVAEVLGDCFSKGPALAVNSEVNNVLEFMVNLAESEPKFYETIR